MAQTYAKLAPYSAIRWKDTRADVRLDDQWLTLESINDVALSRIVEFAKKSYGATWQKRIDEDLVQVLSEMGQPPGNTVKLTLRDSDGIEKTIERAPMTEANRRSIMEFKCPRERRPAPVPAVTAETLHRALDEFKTALDERWSYRHANGADFDSAIAALHKKVDAGLSGNDFGVELQKIIALGIDGHSSVSGFTTPSAGHLPFLIEPEGERFVGFAADRTGFVVAGFPYVITIDNRPVSEWVAAAAVLVPKGAPQYVRRHSLRLLRDLDFVRGLMNLPKHEFVEFELLGIDGKSRNSIAMPVAATSPVYGDWPRGNSRMLDGKIGYLRLPSMDRNADREVRQSLLAFRDTAGLIVDVRDNGGGSRDSLLQLYTYVAAPTDPPRVFTAAAYRLHPDHKADHLASRFMYPADSPQWNASERQAVAEFATQFQPKWKLPKDQFSDWHYMTLSRLDDAAVFHYQKPVVVLMNEKCFSATDIFLAGLKGMKNVTLLGTPSGGGSALAQTVSLTGTPFRVRIGSMASFQADGSLFDGNGVQPDVVVSPVAEFHIGGRDNQLEEAVKRIK